ncbi:hypothetical protein NDU88_005901 [Pleurodeles waltl]|uniref:Uncharacterized protein n=1 Tax=Pleurodeles waltl TaxID=8319 RepID=A0AAV7TBX3_PLEWA|nr:hypothetical protein NDU88_005901 [Pleurodeles waltl]
MAAPHVLLQGTHDNAETLHSRDHKMGKGRQREQGCHSADLRSGELGGAGEGSMEVGSAQGEGEDGRVLVYRKWPRMLVWSDSDSEGGDEVDEGDCLGRASPPMQVKPPGHVYGQQEQFLEGARAVNQGVGYQKVSE